MKERSRLAISSMLLLATWAFLHLWSPGEALPIRKPLATFPIDLDGWRGRETPLLSDREFEILRPSDYLIRLYQDRAGRDLVLYIGYWATQRRGAQIHSPKNCLPGGGWMPLEASVVPVDLGERRIEVNRYLLQKGDSYLLVVYWFQSQGQAIARELDSRIAMVKNSLLHHRSDGAVVRVSTEVRGGVPETWDRLVDYIRVMYPKLREFLPD